MAQQFPKYGLYAYGEGEGKHLERLQWKHHTLCKLCCILLAKGYTGLPRLKAEKFSGIPVLFIPGNSGSHKQVLLKTRSIFPMCLICTCHISLYRIPWINRLQWQNIDILLKGEISGKCGIEDGNQKVGIQGEHWAEGLEELSFDIFLHSQVHFDYFSVDFDEEHSAFYGGVLNDQVHYRLLQLHNMVAFIHCRMWMLLFAPSKVEFVSEAVSKILSLYKGKQGTPTR